MISTRTPLRVTLGGGGTDLESYYRHGGGFIFAMALDKYIHITAHRPAFERRVLIHGPHPEAADRSLDIQHELVREALLRHGLHDRVELASIADIAGGTGLGSSSCFLVGFLHALHALKGERPTPAQLAEEACTLEIDVLNKGIGKQDQYMAAFGGLTTLDIAPDGKVTVGKVELEPEVEAAFVRHTHIYYTGLRRDAAVILEDQHKAMLGADERDEARRKTQENLGFIKDLGYRIRDAWKAGDLEGWGQMLHEHWTHKKKLSSKISWPHIDAIYDEARSAYGVTGGKVIGAGGGGFLMLFTPGDGEALEAFMSRNNMPRLHYGVDHGGTRVLEAVG